MADDRDFLRRLTLSVVVVATAALVLYALYLAREALLVVYLSGLLAMGFSPLVRLMETDGRGPHRRGVPRVLAIFVLYFLIIGALTGIALVVVPPITQQVEALWANMPALLQDAERVLQQHRLLSQSVSLQQAVGSAGTENTVGTLAAAAGSLLNALFGLLSILILSFYLLVEGWTLSHTLARIFPAEDRPRIVETTHQIVGRVSAWLLAQLILAGVMGAVAGLGLGLMHVPYFSVVALVAAAGEMIPMIGPFIGGVCAVGMALTVSIRLALIVLVFFVVLQQIESNILVPKIMEQRVGLSAVTVIVALLIGYELSGLLGAILAVPTAAILAVLFDELMPASDAGAGPSPDSP